MSIHQPPANSSFAPTPSSPGCLRGVNLGNWLLLENWMSPALYPERGLGDEYSLSAHLGPKAESVLRHHRETWVTEDDFAWLAALGINSVRIPFGYWILEADGPYVASPELLDFAVDCCERHGLTAVLDFHGLPGSQGPDHHTGRSKHFAWPADAGHWAHSLEILEMLAQRYAGRRGIAGLSLVNEPHDSIPRETLVDFYEKGYERVRRHMPAEEVAVVIAAYPEGRMPMYHGSLGARANVWTDVHLYQSFCGWPDENLPSYLQKAIDRHQKVLKWVGEGPVMVGEWSLSWPGELARPLRALPQAEQDQYKRTYANIQLASFAATHGWYFWSYKTEAMPEWSFRSCVERGWLPDDFASKKTLVLPATATEALADAALISA